MKQGIHPDYHPVVFRDISADTAFLTRSTVTSSTEIYTILFVGSVRCV